MNKLSEKATQGNQISRRAETTTNISRGQTTCTAREGPLSRSGGRNQRTRISLFTIWSFTQLTRSLGNNAPLAKPHARGEKTIWVNTKPPPTELKPTHQLSPELHIADKLFRNSTAHAKPPARRQTRDRIWAGNHALPTKRDANSSAPAKASHSSHRLWPQALQYQKRAMTNREGKV